MQFLTASLLALCLFSGLYAQKGSKQRSLPVCIHEDGVWNEKEHVLHLLGSEARCEVATRSKTYSWGEGDDENFKAMELAGTNAMTLEISVLYEVPEDANAKSLVSMELHRARAYREMICAHHPDWLIVGIVDDKTLQTFTAGSETYIFTPRLEPCGLTD